jgi:hypothetical protein
MSRRLDRTQARYRAVDDLLDQDMGIRGIFSTRWWRWARVTLARPTST